MLCNMEYTFFYLSAVIIPILFIICCFFRKPVVSNILIGLVSIGYSLINDIILGDRLKLFHYIIREHSTLYMVLAAITIYAPLNITYTMFLPQKLRPSIIYTGFWIIALLIFEILSLLTKTIVFTGWKMFPWSIVLYIVSYLWIYSLYRFLQRKIPSST